jgi:hypothetical protein
MCFNPRCSREASPEGIAILLQARDLSQGMAMVGCAGCSRLGREEVLARVRDAVRQYFGLAGSAPPKAGFVDHLDMSSCTVEGIELAIINGVDCPPAYAFQAMLAQHLLPQFAFAFVSIGNCFAIVHHLAEDFAKLGLADLIQPKTGFSHRLCDNGKPLGKHAWIEWDGFIIDAANGGAGKPVMFERAKEYIARYEIDGVSAFTMPKGE